MQVKTCKLLHTNMEYITKKYIYAFTLLLTNKHTELTGEMAPVVSNLSYHSSASFFLPEDIVLNLTQ